MKCRGLIHVRKFFDGLHCNQVSASGNFRFLGKYVCDMNHPVKSKSFVHERVPLTLFCCCDRSTSKALNRKMAPSLHSKFIPPPTKLIKITERNCKTHATRACFAEIYPPSPCNVDPVKPILTSLLLAAVDEMKAATAVSAAEVSPVLRTNLY